MTLALTGHAVARGIAIGQAHVAERSELEIGEYRIQPEDIGNEIQRFRDAMSSAREQLEELSARISPNAGTATPRTGGRPGRTART